ncbi:MAG: chloride channel protein [Polyangiaceae bacterium]|nr:chloride channel protein [Polyangiaceae bacterium]
MRIELLQKHGPLPLRATICAALIGVGVGTLGAAFRALVEILVETVHEGAQRLNDIPPATFLFWGLFLLACLGGGFFLALVSGLVRRFAPEAAGSGVQEVEAVLAGQRRLRPLRVLVTKFFGGVVALGSGLALGREGPTIQMGAALAWPLGKFFSKKGKEEREFEQLSFGAGAAAGLAAAFNAPLSGLLLMLEEMRGRFNFSSHSLQFVMLATFISDISVRLWLGDGHILAVDGYQAPALRQLPSYFFLGTICGVLGALFNWVLLFTREKLKPRRRLLFWGGLWGVSLPIQFLLVPDLVGDGYLLANEAIGGQFAYPLLSVLLLGRFCFILAGYSTGVPGGVFAPLVSLGMLLGALWHSLFELESSALALAVAGIGGLFSASIAAPITGIVLAIELTGELEASVSLLTCALGAMMVTRLLGTVGLYESLGRDLPSLPSLDGSSSLSSVGSSAAQE